MVKRLIILVSVILTGLIVAGCSGQGPGIDKVAPDFQLTSLQGETVSLKDFRGKPVLVNFWATWCGPCRYEMPFLQSAHTAWSEKGLVILAVDIGEDPATVKKFVQDNGLTFMVLLDAKEEVSLRYNVRAIPTSFLIDKNGVIRDVKTGAFMHRLELDTRLKKIIQ